MCQAIDEIREDSRIEAHKEMAIALIKEKVFTNSKIAELIKLSIEEINQLQKRSSPKRITTNINNHSRDAGTSSPTAYHMPIVGDELAHSLR